MQTIWRYRDETWTGMDVSGFEVEAIDGSIGKVDRAAGDARGSSLVVDTGPWIFGKKVVLPAGVIERIDVEEGRVFVDRTKDEIKSAPEFDESMLESEEGRGELAGYYGRGGRGWRDADLL